MFCSQGLPNNVQPSYLRLRDKAGNTMGKVLRDDAVLRSCFTTLEDGKTLVVQVLDAPERVTRRDLLVAVRVWRPLAGKLMNTREVLLPKATSAGDFKALLHRQFHVGVSPAADGATAGAGDGVGAGHELTTQRRVVGDTKEECAAIEAAVNEGPSRAIQLAVWTRFQGPLSAKTAASLKWGAEVCVVCAGPPSASRAPALRFQLVASCRLAAGLSRSRL